MPLTHTAPAQICTTLAIVKTKPVSPVKRPQLSMIWVKAWDGECQRLVAHWISK